MPHVLILEPSVIGLGFARGAYEDLTNALRDLGYHVELVDRPIEKRGGSIGFLLEAEPLVIHLGQFLASTAIDVIICILLDQVGPRLRRPGKRREGRSSTALTTKSSADSLFLSPMTATRC
jgi:hypothetical protein